MASHVCRVAQELANANIFDHFMASHMRLRAEASHKGCFEASEQAELVASMIMMTRWQKQIQPLLSEKFKNLIIKIQNKFNSFLIYATSESLDISRIHKVDKCHMMMTSQVSCQGHCQPSVISVSSSLPLGTPPVPIRALWELFNGCARFGNQTWRRSEYSDKRRRTVNDVDGAVVFIARTMPCHRTRASFTHLSEIQIHQTKPI